MRADDGGADGEECGDRQEEQDDGESGEGRRCPEGCDRDDAGGVPLRDRELGE